MSKWKTKKKKYRRRFDRENESDDTINRKEIDAFDEDKKCGITDYKAGIEYIYGFGCSFFY